MMIYRIIIIFSFFTFMLSIIGKGQEYKKEYFNDLSLQKEVPRDVASYCKVIIINPDSTITHQIYKLRRSQFEISETYKNNEPYGVWVENFTNGTRKWDYNFDLILSNNDCPLEIIKYGIDNFFVDNDSLKYAAPRLNGKIFDIRFEIANNIEINSHYKESGLRGRSFLQILFNEKGEVERIEIRKEDNRIISKEAARVIRNFKYDTPAMLNGVPIPFCVLVPISYKSDPKL